MSTARNKGARIAAASLALAGCGGVPARDAAATNLSQEARQAPRPRPDARLTARVHPPSSTNEPSHGLHSLALAEHRDGLVYVPESYDASRPAPLVVMLHGAGGNAKNALGIVKDYAEAAGALVLAPDSRGRTWDLFASELGPDVGFIDQALEQTFGRYSVDPGRIAIAGFSDGASYALTLGLANGDLFQDIVAFSPGCSVAPALAGKPRVFISHGARDRVLPIDQCSRVIVPRLKGQGYDVELHEFDGPHFVPKGMVRAAFAFLQREWARRSGQA